MSQIKKIADRMEITPKPERIGNVIPAQKNDEVVTLGQLNNFGINTSVSYKKYIALLTQEGTNAPTAIVLENTFLFIPTYTYVNIGRYSINFPTGTLTINKTVSIITSKSGAQAVGSNRTSDEIIAIQSGNFSALTDDSLANNYLEIRVYN